ncbi:MAG: hypothetical protein IPJ31_10645 [Bacteroidetes bacterium]|nr:hypothetical protein [Bacteroidota bacterium]
MISIKVYNTVGVPKELQLLPGTTIDMEYLLPSFDDRLDGSDFSLPFRIPFTDHNRQLLGYAEHLNTNAINIPEYWRCDVYDDHVLYAQDAKLKLLSHNGRFDNKDGSYNFNVSGIKGFFGTQVKGKLMKDLALDGIINWNAAMDSREFSKDLMDGNQPQYQDRITFAPVAMTDFFDTSRNDYLGEFIIDEIVNNIIIDGTYPNGWTFARYKTGAPLIALAPGDPEYADYRTVPFYNLFYVLRKIFTEHGFTVDGSFFSSPDLDKLFIFNNFAIERYDYPFTFDVNTQITPANHMPAMSIVEFLVALQNTFNLKIIFRSGFKVFINFKEETISATAIKDVTNKIDLYFESAQRHESFYGGQALRWKWDTNDSYHNDRVKEIKDLDIIAEVNTFADIAALGLGAPTVTQFIYVAAENYYYNWNATLSIWEPYSEQQLDYEEGQMTTEFAPMISPLCQHYAYDVPSGFILSKDKCATKMLGSYWCGAKEQVTNPFELHLFFAQKFTAGAYTDMPISFSHNYDTNGVKRVAISLSWLAIDGLLNKFWKKWLLMLKNSFELQAKAHFNITDLSKPSGVRYFAHRSK